MDFDFRALGIHSAKHISAVQAARLRSELIKLEAAESKQSTKMTNCIENESNSPDDLRPKLVGELLKLRQSIGKIGLPTLSWGEKYGSCPSTRSHLYVQCEGEKEKGAAAYSVDVGDQIKIEKPYDSSSDEDNLSGFYDSDGDDDARSYFPCPFCYMEIEVPLLCSHLQEEHCFDLKNAVCPLCALNLGKDATGHFIVQHSSSLKRRRKSEKSNSWSGNSTMLGKKLVTNSRGNRRESMADPLLSPFICNISVQNPNNILQDQLSSNNVSTISDAKSAGTDAPDHQERRQKAAFVQKLVASTIF